MQFVETAKSVIVVTIYLTPESLLLSVNALFCDGQISSCVTTYDHKAALNIRTCAYFSRRSRQIDNRDI